MTTAVILLSPWLDPPAGGIQRLADDLLLALGADVVRAIAVSEAERADARVHVIRRRHRHRPAQALQRVRFAAAAVRAVAGDGTGTVVHALTWRAAAPLLLVPARRRPPLVLHCMGGELNRCRGAAHLVRRRVFAAAAEVVAISAFTAALAESVSGRRPVVVPPALRSLPATIAVGAAAGEVLRVLTVSRLVPHKGHDDLIRAVAEVRAAGRPVELTVVGTGPAEPALRRLPAALGIEGHVRFTGRVADDELDRLYRDADVFALLTREDGDEVEGFGIVFVEAAAYGLPVVAGRAGGTSDAVNDGTTGMLVSGVGEAADALTTLADDADLRHRLGAAGRRWAEGFGLDRLRAAMIDVYESARAR